MKKLLFALCTLTLFITSCSQEELDGLNNNARDAKIATYKERAQRLAEKYGIDMQLNEEHIDDIIKNLSFEQMEKDFAMIANMEISSNNKTSKLGIKRRVSLSEAYPTFEKNIYASFGGDYGVGIAKVTWHYIPYGGSFADVTISFPTSPTFYYSSIGSPHLVFANRYSFEVSDSDVVTFYSQYYRYTKHCSIVYKPEQNIEHIRIY